MVTFGQIAPTGRRLVVLVTAIKLIYHLNMICTGVIVTTAIITWQGEQVVKGICGDASVGQEIRLMELGANILQENYTTTILWHGPKNTYLEHINGAFPQLPIKRAIDFLNGVFLHRRFFTKWHTLWFILIMFIAITNF